MLERVRPGPGDCIVSTFAPGSHGYPQAGWQQDGERGGDLCHRIAYVHHKGPIPSDMTVDHVCRNRCCVNPDHLRLLSNRVNATLNGNAIKTHCPRGHEYTEANTRLQRHPSGRLHRYCRACQAISNARRRVDAGEWDPRAGYGSFPERLLG